MPNWDMGMGPKPGPWGTEAEDVATAGGGKERYRYTALKPRPDKSVLLADLLEIFKVVLIIVGFHFQYMSSRM